MGGTAVGRSLLELTAEAFELIRKDQPDARMVMVTGSRLDHFGAGVRLDYATTTPPQLAAAMIAARTTRPSYRPVGRGGEQLAARQLAPTLVR